MSAGCVSFLFLLTYATLSLHLTYFQPFFCPVFADHYTTIEDNTRQFGILNFGKNFTASINVGNGAEIISDSDVTLSSTVNANCTDEIYSDLYFNSKLDVAGDIKAKNINLESKIIDNYTYSRIETNDEATEDNSSILNSLPFSNNSGVMKLFNNAGISDFIKKDEATLNIADTAKLEATKNINVNAASEITGKINAEISSKNDAGASAFNAIYLRNSSALNIGGSLKAGGNINIESTAGLDLSSLVKVDFDKSNNTATSLALNLALGQNQSQLTISKTADINAGGKLDISSLAKSPVNMETNIQREGSDLGAFSISSYQINSSSLLNSEGTLTAKGDINVSSKYSAATFKVNTKISVTNPVSGMEQTTEEAEKTKEAGAAVNELINGSGSSDGSGDEETSEDNITTNATLTRCEG